MKTFNLENKVNGYVNKKDITNIDGSVLVKGSQNVIINDSDKIVTRGGYTLDGAANTALTPIISSYEWKTSRGTELALRSYQGELEYRSGGIWYRLTNGWGSAVEFQFAEWWDVTEKKDCLLFVNGSSNIYSWYGGVTTYASSTINTITKQGTSTWAESGFLIGGTRQIIINGITYTYTGGEGTITLTGVTPDPTAGGLTAGIIVVQAIRTSANQPYASSSNDIIGVHRNQVYLGDSTRKDTYVSKNTSFIDYTFTAPTRLPGEGAILTLDNPPVGFVSQESDMYVAGLKDDWYKTRFTLSDDLSKEKLDIDKLKSGPQQGAKSQALIGKIKNSVVYVSNEPTFDTLGRIENIDTPQAVPISDPIKLDFNEYDFTNGHVLFFKSVSYIALPVEGLVLMYDHSKGYWQPPQVLPVRRLAIIEGNLYGHSSATPETYKLFTGTNDNGNSMKAVAKRPYVQYGQRSWQKNHDEWYIEGYITPVTDIQHKLLFDYGGYSGEVSSVVRGDDTDIIFNRTEDASLGKSSLGKRGLGTLSAEATEKAKFRVKFEMHKNDYYEIQESFESDDTDQSWEILASGPNVVLSSGDDESIKK